MRSNVNVDTLHNASASALVRTAVAASSRSRQPPSLTLGAARDACRGFQDWNRRHLKALGSHLSDGPVTGRLPILPTASDEKHPAFQSPISFALGPVTFDLRCQTRLYLRLRSPRRSGIMTRTLGTFVTCLAFWDPAQWLAH